MVEQILFKRRIFNAIDLNAVTTATTSTANFDFRGYRRITWFINVTVNTGAVTLTIQGSIDGLTWFDVNSKTYTATTGNDVYMFGYNTYYPFMRTKTTTHSNATLTSFVAVRD